GSSIQYGQTFGQNFYQLLTDAQQEMHSFQDEYLSTEILLLTLFRLKNHPLTAYLTRKGITRDNCLQQIKEVRGGDRVTSQEQENQYQALEKYGIDLVQAMKSGEHDPVI